MGEEHAFPEMASYKLWVLLIYKIFIDNEILRCKYFYKKNITMKSENKLII